MTQSPDLSKQQAYLTEAAATQKPPVKKERSPISKWALRQTAAPESYRPIPGKM